MLAIFERGLGQFIMRPHRRDYRDRVYVRRIYQFVEIAMHRDSGMRRLYALSRRRRLVAYSDHLATFEAAQIAHDIRPPIPVADDAKLDHGTYLRRMRLLGHESAGG